MRAVILAAGRGGRLRGVVGTRPKCLARVGTSTLLERQIDALRSAGLDPITVVAGFGEADVRRACPPGVEILTNPTHATTNSLYSLWLARHVLEDGFVVLNCDVLFHPQLLADLVGSPYGDALLTSARGENGPYSPEEMKVQIRGGLVRAIDKTLADDISDAENIGIGKFSAEGARALVAELDRIVGSGDVRAWLPRGFDAFARSRALHAIDNRGLPWIEIDFPEDYWRACSETLPAIEENSSSCMNAFSTSVSVPFRSARIPSTSIQAGST
ncbi:MAG TPA: phosphocholine cytidylyltransferase family protein, partial [Vicinamibacterales bacterium]|nr:phosphocholine cytidylyltransferase family protein [Vicinamibacterales bacterium]